MTRAALIILLVASAALANQDEEFFDAWWAAAGSSPSSWSPADLGAQLWRWYEADPFYMLGPAGNPTQLLDKAGTAYSLAVTNPAAAPAYAVDTNGVGFLLLGAGADAYRSYASPVPEVGIDFSVLLVFSPTDTVVSTTPAAGIAFATNNSAPGRAAIVTGNGSSSWTGERITLYSAISTDVRGYGCTNDLTTEFGGHLWMNTGTNQNNIQYYYNGQTRYLNKSASGIGHFTTNNYPARWNAMGLLSGTATRFCALVVCTGRLSAADADRITGWAAHRWGFEADLPEGHPYRLSPP